MINRIIEIREKESLSQEKFAKRLGLSRNFINQVENGKKNLSDRTILDICKEFNINEEWLRNGTGEMHSKIDEDFASICAEIGVNDEKAKMAIMKYCQLSDEDKKLFWNFIERFLK